MNIVEITSVLDNTGLKRVSLNYNIDLDTLYIKENDDIIKTISNNDELYNNLLNDFNLLKDEVNTIKIRVNELTSRSGVRSTLLTPSEQRIGYYYHCMTHNYGQGVKTMFRGYKELSFEYVEEKWFEILKKYEK